MKKFLSSLSCAVAGIVHTFETQRNMRFHGAGAVTALGLGLYLQVSMRELVLVVFAITLVIMAELFNTALEAAVDIHEKEFHPMARIAKDVAAGAVLVAVLNSLVVAYLVFFPRLEVFMFYGTPHVRRAPLSVTITGLLLVSLALVAAKVMAKRVPLVKRGLPSSHAALSFAGATALLLLTGSATVATIGVILALIAVHGRLAAGTHSFFEVVTGALLGAFITMAAFRLGGW
ncbi:MAG: diacylglycerol kinase [Eubacteriales bacterium]